MLTSADEFEAEGKRIPGTTREERGLIRSVFELISLWPKMTRPGLEERSERFIMSAAPADLLRMQAAIFQEATPYLVEDERVAAAMRDLSGRQIGMAVKGVYESTVLLDELCFRIEPGIRVKMPVIWVASRRDYADAILGRRDPIRMVLTRRIWATHMITLARWVWPHLDLLKDRALLDKFLCYQPEVETVLDETLTALGY